MSNHLCTNEHYCRHIFGSLLNLYVSITVCQLFRSPIRQQCMHGSNNFFLFSKKKRRTMHACRRRVGRRKNLNIAGQ